MAPYYQDDQVTLWHGDSLAMLREMPDASVDCCVTSPPYFGLRDYGEEGQYGLESSPSEYVETMRALFAEVRRVLADDGTLWLNIGDLAQRAILAGCKPGGTVLDPFSGSGTTGAMATKHGRKYVGVDLSSNYLDLSLRTRFAQPGLDLTGGVA